MIAHQPKSVFQRVASASCASPASEIYLSLSLPLPTRLRYTQQSRQTHFRRRSPEPGAGFELLLGPVNAHGLKEGCFFSSSSRWSRASRCVCFKVDSISFACSARETCLPLYDNLTIRASWRSIRTSASATCRRAWETGSSVGLTAVACGGFNNGLHATVSPLASAVTRTPSARSHKRSLEAAIRSSLARISGK